MVVDVECMSWFYVVSLYCRRPSNRCAIQQLAEHRATADWNAPMRSYYKTQLLDNVRLQTATAIRLSKLVIVLFESHEWTLFDNAVVTTTIRLRFDCSSTALYDHSTTYVSSVCVCHVGCCIAVNSSCTP